MILSIDIGGTALKSALFDGDVLVEKKELESDGSQGTDLLVQNLYRIIDGYRGVEAIGIDTAGLVDQARGVITCAGNLGIDSDFPLADIIREKYGVPVLLANDVNAAALGEAHYGAAREDDNFICLTYGTGIGGAIVIDKKVYVGNTGMAGEMGHIVTHPGGIACSCGISGCYERYASTTALVEAAKKADPTAVNGRLVFDRLNAGSAEMETVVDNWIDEVVLGLVSLTHVFNPSAIVLGGGIMNEDYIVSRIAQRLPRRVIKSYSGVKIKHALLGNSAGVYGMLSAVKTGGILRG